jgi:6-pyruvoyltetrahydropterin/6-carboxytetrahydropterin synthase
MFEISSEACFSAAHHLKNYQGPCENLHGHNWSVRAYVQCPKLNDLGIGIDFRTLKNALAETIAKLDHGDLNEIFDPRGENPSSENIAAYIFRKLEQSLNNESCRVSKVEVSETPGNTASFFL